MGLILFVARDGSLPPSPRRVKEPVAAYRNLSIEAGTDLFGELAGGSDLRPHRHPRPVPPLYRAG
jgi:hypothetical protein